METSGFEQPSCEQCILCRKGYFRVPVNVQEGVSSQLVQGTRSHALSFSSPCCACEVRACSLKKAHLMKTTSIPFRTEKRPAWTATPLKPSIRSSGPKCGLLASCRSRGSGYGVWPLMVWTVDLKHNVLLSCHYHT